MTNCLFVTDLHGRIKRYKKLFNLIITDRPNIVLLGGDLLPSGISFFSKRSTDFKDFTNEFLEPNLKFIKETLQEKYPKICLILGNDDPRIEEQNFLDLEKKEYLNYIHYKKTTINDFTFYGYSFIPPSPFQLKDWEKYDVSRYIDPGCVSPEEGIRTIDIEKRIAKYSTIREDLTALLNYSNHQKSVFLFHCPPYKTKLDRAALDGKMIDHVPLDVNIGSIAIRESIELHQPMLTLHGHVHESTSLTNSWKDKIGKSLCFNGAHDGSELSVIKFTLENPENAQRLLY